MNESKLLIHEQPLQVLPMLATAIGLNEAIVLQQIHYWLEINRKANKNFEDDCTWTYNSYEAWQADNFPFWSASTVKRAFNQLRNKELIRAEQRRKADYDRRIWVTIRYDKLAELEREIAGDDEWSARQGQDDPIGRGKMSQSTYTETTTDSFATAETADCSVDFGESEYAVGEYVKASKHINPELDIKPGTVGIVTGYSSSGSCIVDFVCVGDDEGLVVGDIELRRGKVNKPFKPSQQQRMIGVIVAQFGWSMSDIDEVEYSNLGGIVKRLVAKDITTDDIPLLYKHIKRKGFSTFGPNALPKYVADYRATQRKRTTQFAPTSDFAPPSLKPTVTRRETKVPA